MSLVIEDGTGLANSESYISVADADIYHLNRGHSAWAALTTPQKEVALRKATDHLTQLYRFRWKGYRSFPSTQALDWPRQFVSLDDGLYPEYIEFTGIPVELKNACCELALRSIDEDLNPDVEREVKSESVGSISVTYMDGSAQTTEFRAVEMMLRPLLSQSIMTGKIIRS